MIFLPPDLKVPWHLWHFECHFGLYYWSVKIVMESMTFSETLKKTYLTFQWCWGLFHLRLWALQNNLAKIYNARNHICGENFKLKLCMCTQSMALGTHIKFQLGILMTSMNSAIHNFEIIFWRACETLMKQPPVPADVLVMIGARTSAGAVMTKFGSCICTYIHIYIYWHLQSQVHVYKCLRSWLRRLISKIRMILLMDAKTWMTSNNNGCSASHMRSGLHFQNV